MLRCCLALVLAALLAAPAGAQLAVEPPNVSVSVLQGETVTRTVTLTNTGTEPLAFCLNFDRPLQRTDEALRLSEEKAAGLAPCGTYGEVLYYLDEEGAGGFGWDPFGSTMTPDGRLFTSTLGGFPWRTFELTPDLQVIRFFEHPHIEELTPFSGSPGITYDTESGTLWWMNTERAGGSGTNTRRILLLEGNFEGEETGRRIELVPPDTPLEDFLPSGLSYEPATDLFYFSAASDGEDSTTRELWAVDRTGTLAEGYPFRAAPYPLPAGHGRPDVHGGPGGGPEGVRVEFAVYPSFDAPGYDRVVVVDRWGNSEGEELETPVPAVLFESGGAGVRGNPLRSRIDPNGVMYLTFNNFDHRGIVGVRPHPLPPSWVVVDSDAGPEGAWDGTLAPGESRTVELTFRPGSRSVGDYPATLQTFTAATGEVVEVPLTLAVTQGTDTEAETAAPEASSLAVYPNPAAGSATVALTLAAPSAARVAVYDVLGRTVAVLHDGPLAAGAYRFPLGAARLPAGIYLVRATGDDVDAARRVMIVR